MRDLSMAAWKDTLRHIPDCGIPEQSVLGNANLGQRGSEALAQARRQLRQKGSGYQAPPMLSVHGQS